MDSDKLGVTVGSWRLTGPGGVFCERDGLALRLSPWFHELS